MRGRGRWSKADPHLSLGRDAHPARRTSGRPSSQVSGTELPGATEASGLGRRVARRACPPACAPAGAPRARDTCTSRPIRRAGPDRSSGGPDRDGCAPADRQGDRAMAVRQVDRQVVSRLAREDVHRAHERGHEDRLRIGINLLGRAICSIRPAFITQMRSEWRAPPPGRASRRSRQFRSSSGCRGSRPGLDAQFRIEIGKRLVHQEQLRPDHHGASRGRCAAADLPRGRPGATRGRRDAPWRAPRRLGGGVSRAGPRPSIRGDGVLFDGQV